MPIHCENACAFITCDFALFRIAMDANVFSSSEAGPACGIALVHVT